MATTAKAKWEKYFAHGDVETHIKPKAGKPIYFYPLDDSGPISLSDGDRIVVKCSNSYSPRYRVAVRHLGDLEGYVNEQFVGKPISDSARGPTELLRVHSETLIGGGHLGSVDIGRGATDARIFDSAESLHESIVDGLRSNWRVSEAISQQFFELFENGCQTSFKWKEEISESERNELGKYVGELVPGSFALAGDWSAFSDQFITFKPTVYGIPTDPSCSGFDSYLAGDGNSCLISSKFGPGAKASVFSNILPEAVRQRGFLTSSELGYLVDAVQVSGVTPEVLEAKRGSKEVLYTYGLNNLLGMRVKSPMTIFQNLRAHVLDGTELSSEACDVLNEVAARAEPIIRDKLPGSITQFFSRSAAARLNGDAAAIDDMKTVLALKDFVQLNLNMKRWRAGEINFKVTRSAESELKIVGNKGIIGDIDSRQGMLNYEIR